MTQEAGEQSHAARAMAQAFAIEAPRHLEVPKEGHKGLGRTYTCSSLLLRPNRGCCLTRGWVMAQTWLKCFTAGQQATTSSQRQVWGPLV